MADEALEVLLRELMRDGQGEYMYSVSVELAGEGARIDKLDGASEPQENPVVRLSRRELQIADFLAEGHSTINVASILGLSENTIRTYVRRLYGKLGVCSRVELVNRMTECGRRTCAPPRRISLLHTQERR